MVDIDYGALFQNFPPEIATLLIALLPIAELRLAIPTAIEVFDMSIWAAFLWSVIGNMIPAVLLLLFLDPVARFLMERSRFFNKFFSWIFKRTTARFRSKASQYGTFIALMLFVAVPLPITGAWTGAAAAFLFKMPFHRALLAVTIGVLIAGVIVTMATVGISSLF
ncbi:MAG: small multi-drug export protein [Patescibacteria group bacterium]